ncbi:hypothetical protein AOR11_25445 [Vibrio alginolyticus]|nr:hypothetical protein AOR11_25445 [Vibrio alginolyticus]
MSNYISVVAACHSAEACGFCGPLCQTIFWASNHGFTSGLVWVVVALRVSIDPATTFEQGIRFNFQAPFTCQDLSSDRFKVSPMSRGFLLWYACVMIRKPHVNAASGLNASNVGVKHGVVRAGSL